MKTSLEVIYKKPDEIYLKVEKNSVLLVSKDKKQINASEIYKALDYKIDKTYELKPLTEYKEIPDDFLSYLKDIYEIMQSIVIEIQ